MPWSVIGVAEDMVEAELQGIVGYASSIIAADVSTDQYLERVDPGISICIVVAISDGQSRN
jgi:hypothetical protein